jgi:hypothetical protein
LEIQIVPRLRYKGDLVNAAGGNNRKGDKAHINTNDSMVKRPRVSTLKQVEILKYL